MAPTESPSSVPTLGPTTEVLELASDGSNDSDEGGVHAMSIVVPLIIIALMIALLLRHRKKRVKFDKDDQELAGMSAPTTPMFTNSMRGSAGNGHPRPAATLPHHGSGAAAMTSTPGYGLPLHASETAESAKTANPAMAQ